MKKTIVLTLGLLLSQAAWADAIQDISITDPYARAVPPNQPNSAAFMVLDNSSDTPHAIISAASPVAEVVELHTHVEVDGMMQMRPIAKIEIAAKNQTELKPGGLHVMLIGLTQQLKPGDSVTATLHYEDGSSEEISAPVKKVSTGMPLGSATSIITPGVARPLVTITQGRSPVSIWSRLPRRPASVACTSIYLTSPLPKTWMRSGR